MEPHFPLCIDAHLHSSTHKILLSSRQVALKVPQSWLTQTTYDPKHLNNYALTDKVYRMPRRLPSSRREEPSENSPSEESILTSTLHLFPLCEAQICVKPRRAAWFPKPNVKRCARHQTNQSSTTDSSTSPPPSLSTSSTLVPVADSTAASSAALWA